MISVSLAPVKLTVGAGAVWALEKGSGQVTRIDPQTGSPKLLAEGVGASSSIAVDRNAVWLGGNDGVTKLDLRSGVELGKAPVPEVVKSATTSIAVGADAVWFVGDSSPRLWRILPPSVSTRDSFEIDASPSALAVGDDGAVWVAGGSVTSLWRLDPKRNEARHDPARRDLGRPRRRVRQHLDEPRSSRRVGPGRFCFSNDCSSIRRCAADSGSRCWPLGRASPCSCRVLSPVRRANRGRDRRGGGTLRLMWGPSPTPSTLPSLTAP